MSAIGTKQTSILTLNMSAFNKCRRLIETVGPPVGAPHPWSLAVGELDAYALATATMVRPCPRNHMGVDAFKVNFGQS